MDRGHHPGTAVCERTPGDYRFRGVSTAADGDRIAVTSAWSYNEDRYVYVSSDAGLNWSTVTVANPSTYNGAHLYVLADKRLLLVRSNDVYATQILASAGSDWTTLEKQPGSSDPALQVRQRHPRRDDPGVQPRRPYRRRNQATFQHRPDQVADHRGARRLTGHSRKGASQLCSLGARCKQARRATGREVPPTAGLVTRFCGVASGPHCGARWLVRTALRIADYRVSPTGKSGVPASFGSGRAGGSGSPRPQRPNREAGG